MSEELNLTTSFEKLTKFIVAYFHNKDDSLNEAKDFFSSFINSFRKLERVENIQQLLALLKRYGLFGPYDRTALRIFLKIIHDDAFSDMVTKHNALLNSLSRVDQEPIKNVYAERRRHLINDSETQTPLRQQPPPPQVPSSSSVVFTLNSSVTKRNEILKLVSRSISSSEFRRLARHLNFREPEIKNLEVSVMEQETRTMILLRKYEEREKFDYNKFISVLMFLGMKSVAEEIRQILSRSEC